MIRKQEWVESLIKIYGEKELAEEIADQMKERYKVYEGIQKESKWLTEKDAILITYGDTLCRKGEKGLKILNEFLKKYVNDAVSIVHILPMFPYTSDDGFSVVDYRKINEKLGDWQDIEELSKGYQMMFDAVINHISKSSEWFKGYLRCEKPYTEYFHTCDPNADYSSVTRPRSLPLLTKCMTAEGEKYVWTTFSEDQIDLNYGCPEVLIEILDILLTYAKQGARLIRLDAIGFLWKEMGTSCMHLEKTHEVIRLMRKVLEDYAPGTLIITETNVPHMDNISYFGDGTDEAHLVYQFPLPPLTLFSLLTGNAEKLSRWADSLEPPAKGTTFLNFLSSHDGIGIRPTEGILTCEEQKILLDAALKSGGEISYKDNGDGTRSPYELNVNYQDALSTPEEADEVRIAKFLAAETILLSLQGLPGIYIHSLLGSRNDYYGKSISGIPRRINREQLDADQMEQWLSGKSNRKVIFEELVRRLNIRKEHSAFAPDAEQEVLSVDPRIFALRRKNEITKEEIIILINVSSNTILVEKGFTGEDILSERRIEENLELLPYEAKWILV